MKTRISAIVGLLCVLGVPLSASAGELPTMSSGTPELYMSFLSGIAMTRSADATFTDGSGATRTPPVSDLVNGVDYRNNFAIGGNAGVWFPTRTKLWGFDLGMELTGFLWQADVGPRSFYNNDPATNTGTTTEMNGLYIGPNFLIRYPLAISEAYPNGRWFPYVGIGVGMHQMQMRPGGTHGISAFCCTPGGNLNTNAAPDQRDTTHAWMALGGIKGHIIKYVSGFVEAKYLMAHHDGLLTDRYGLSSGADAFPTFPSTGGSTIFLNQYSSSINSLQVHAGLSIHFDIKP